MALIDFSNAKIEIDSGNTTNLVVQQYLNLLKAGSTTPVVSFRDANKGYAATVTARTLVTNTPTKYAVEYTGYFSPTATGGTVMYVYYGTSGTSLCYKISNISYSAGDSFDFVIEAEITVT